MQAFGKTAARHRAAGVLVDEYDLLFLHDVLDFLVEEVMRLERGLELVQQCEVGGRVQRLPF